MAGALYRIASLYVQLPSLPRLLLMSHSLRHVLPARGVWQMAVYPVLILVCVVRAFMQKTGRTSIARAPSVLQFCSIVMAVVWPMHAVGSYNAGVVVPNMEQIMKRHMLCECVCSAVCVVCE
jgi:hypothetical protein